MATISFTVPRVINNDKEADDFIEALEQSAENPISYRSPIESMMQMEESRKQLRKFLKN